MMVVVWVALVLGRVGALTSRTRSFEVVFEGVGAVGKSRAPLLAQFAARPGIVGRTIADEGYRCVLREDGGRCGIYVSSADAKAVSVTARLVGQEAKFDVEAFSGGRVTEEAEVGVNLMTPELLLANFVDDQGRAVARVNVTEFDVSKPLDTQCQFPSLKRVDARRDPGGVVLGSEVVPCWTSLSERSRLAAGGLYGGVDYRVEKITVGERESFVCEPRSTLHLRPMYPLVKRLERRWPVEIDESTVRVFLRPRVYTLIQAASTATVALGALCLAAFFALEVVSLTVVNSLSMAPYIEPGSVLVVDKLSPKINRAYKPGDVVFFSPPTALSDIIGKRSGKNAQRPPLVQADLFVKRVAAVAGDRVRVDPDTLVVTVNGRRLDVDAYPAADAVCEDNDVFAELNRLRDAVSALPTDLTVPQGSVFVLGDCKAVSVDSRVWGLLPISNIQARPLGTIFHR